MSIKEEKNRDCDYVHAIGVIGTLAMTTEHKKSPDCVHERGKIKTGLSMHEEENIQLITSKEKYEV